MYTIILFALIGLLFFPILNKEFDWDDFGLYFIFSVLGAFSGFIIAVALPVKYEKSSWSEKVVSLKDNTSVNGSFFLGFGQINSTMKYVYYQQNPDSTYQMWQANYYDAVIRYTSGEPKIIINDYRKSKSIWNKFAVDINDESRQTYIFEVPQWSIKNSYELDVQ
jgi:hypothetical protein